ncbi:MAG: stealth family protein [Alistipes sp.]|nr:stealth family protein [Alistipes sp.]
MKRERVDFPIDLVYTWVDGNDPAWREKRLKYMPEITTERAPNHLCDARWLENNELMFALRSAELYAPWINRIYIVTDNQVPKWLNTNHPKVKIVDHTEILPVDALPVFSSLAIESCIYRIPGLSEHFIYGNDDTFFGSLCQPEDFFDADGKPIVRMRGSRFNRKYAREKGGNYYKTVYRMQTLVQERWGKLICHEPHHNLDAYRKSDFEKCVALMPEAWESTAHNRFRTNDDMQRCFVSYYAVAAEGAKLRLVGRYNRVKNPAQFLKVLFTGHGAADSRWIKIHLPDYDKEYKKYNPLMFCMNDGSTNTDEQRRRMVEFLNKKFPTKSSFEL